MERVDDTPRRVAVIAYCVTMYVVLILGLAALEWWRRGTVGHGGKAEFVWAFPMAVLLCLPAWAVFGLVLRWTAPRGLALARKPAIAWSMAAGAITPWVLAVVKPLLRWMGAGDLISGLVVSTLLQCVLAAAAAALLASLRPGRAGAG